jgi:regulator of sigma E protease
VIVKQFNKYSWLLLVAALVALVLAKWVLLVVILGLALLITVHEFGHFVAAKLFGMRVEKFYVGFPPAAVKRQWGETEYGIGLIPLGGFCKISGMTPEEKVPPGTGKRTYRAKPAWQRNLTIFAGPFMNFVAAVVIFFVFIQVQGVPTATLTLQSVAPTVKINGVDVRTPAAIVGLRAGDTLIGANGTVWSTWDQAQAFLHANLARPFTLAYRTSAGIDRSARVTLVANPNDAKLGYLGVQAGVRFDRPLPWKTAWLALTQTGQSIKLTFKGFWWLISGKVSATGPNGISGPVGIVRISETAVQQHFYPALLALLSINLGIINLLPILPFDGGHIFFTTLEAVRRRRVDARVLERVVTVGAVLLITLFVLITYLDIKRL